ncbi:MAG: hypothetical protein VKL60_13115 [Sphaerospermopsis sp.]|nr:hypothetical protein [Sphaerospermopsis sp.]
MVNQNPKNLYPLIFNNVYSKIKRIKRGILYKTIQIIVDEEQSQSQTETIKICNLFGIQPNADKEDDKKNIDDLLDEILRNPIVNGSAKLAIINFKGENMEWIFVAAAFTFVGLFYYKQIRDKKQQEKIKLTITATQGQSIPKTPIPADLCLIVPASIVSNFINSSTLKVEEVKYLIDNASYFLCTTVKVADSNEEYLKITDETIPPDSRRDVYIRIKINDGHNMIDQTMRYYLKDNLPIQADCTVKKIACLKNPSGLEKFNRI